MAARAVPLTMRLRKRNCVGIQGNLIRGERVQLSYSSVLATVADEIVAEMLLCATAK
jgi:hypothetical protein